MKHDVQDIFALHYRCFFQLPDRAWSRIFEITLSPFVAWETYFGFPFEGFELDESMREKMKSLPQLYAAECELEDLSITRGLTSLTLLDLSYNELKLDDENRIAGLEKVALTVCGLQNEALSYISNCAELLLDKNRLTTISEILQKNPQLKYLDISDNHFESIENTPHHDALVTIDCRKNFLKNASGLANLSRLQEVHLDNNLLENVDFLFELPELKIVSLSRNRFTPEYLNRLINALKAANIIIEED